MAEAPAQTYNPLFLYGGRSQENHLMHAIGHYMLSQYPHKKVLYVSSEKFTNDLINAIKDDTNEEFRNKYRNMDVLLIDDSSWAERGPGGVFPHQRAYEANKQIIISRQASQEITLRTGSVRGSRGPDGGYPVS